MMRAKLSTCALLLAVSSALHAAPLPSSGMSMQAVESQFGPPLKKNAAVGHPPITRWEYDGFVVVFERSTVVSSVNVSRASAPVTAKAPAPAAAPAKKAAPVAQPVPVATPVPADPVAAPTPAPAAIAPASPAATAPVAPATAAETPTAAPPPAPATPESTTAQDPMSKAAAEKAAEGSTPAAPADSGYSFDPETGRFIIK